MIQGSAAGRHIPCSSSGTRAGFVSLVPVSPHGRRIAYNARAIAESSSCRYDFADGILGRISQPQELGCPFCLFFSYPVIWRWLERLPGRWLGSRLRSDLFLSLRPGHRDGSVSGVPVWSICKGTFPPSLVGVPVCPRLVLSSDSSDVGLTIDSRVGGRATYSLIFVQDRGRIRLPCSCVSA